MNRRLLLSSPAVGVGSRTTSPVAVSRPARRLIGVMLVVAAALDLTDAMPERVGTARRHQAMWPYGHKQFSPWPPRIACLELAGVREFPPASY